MLQSGSSSDDSFDTTIFKNVAKLVEEAIGDIEAWNAELTSEGGKGDYFPSAGQIPRSTVNAPPAVTLPIVSGFSPAPPETPPVLGLTLSKASYSAASTVVGVFTTPTVGSPRYYTATPVPPESEFDEPVPDTGYPEAPFIQVADSAGLQTIAAPIVTVGTAPEFTDIVLLSYTPEYLPLFTDLLPPMPAVPQSDPMPDPVPLEPLSGELIEDIRSTLNETSMLGIQDVLQYLGAKEIKRARLTAEHELFADTAERGFSAETGPLYGAVEDLDYDSTMKYLGVYDESAGVIIAAAREKLVTAIEQGIRLETGNFARHLAYAQQLIEVYETNIRMHMGAFNVVVEMYNAQVQGIELLVSTYNTYVQTNLGQYEAAVAAADQMRAVIDTNSAKVRVYSAQVQTESVRADIYGTDVEQSTLPIKEYEIYIKGLMHNVELAKTNVKAYSQAIDVAVEAVKLDRAKAVEYEARVTTYGSVEEVYESNWDAYSSALNVVNGVNDSALRFNSAALQALQGEISVLKSAIGHQRSYFDGFGRYIAANNAQLSDWLNGVNSAAQFMGAKNSALLQLEGARSNIELTQADMLSLQLALDAQRDAAQAVIDGGLATAEATTLAGLAQAAFSIRSVSTSLGSHSTQGVGKAYSRSASEGVNYSFSEGKTRSKTLSV